MVGIAYYFFIQFYLFTLTIFHVRINHTVGLYNVLPLFKFSKTAQSVIFHTISPQNSLLDLWIADGKYDGWKLWKAIMEGNFLYNTKHGW